MSYTTNQYLKVIKILNYNHFVKNLLRILPMRFESIVIISELVGMTMVTFCRNVCNRYLLNVTKNESDPKNIRGTL